MSEEGDIIPLTSLLAQEDPNLVSVLTHEYFFPALSSNFPELVTYLINPSTIRKMCDWVLTTKYQEDPSVNRMTKIIFQLFLKVQTIDLPAYKEYMINFTKSGEYNVAKLSGNFQELVKQFTKISNGAFIAENEDIRTFLMHNMICLGYRELFIYLVLNYPEQFKPGHEMMEEMLTTNENKLYTVTAMYEIISAKNDNYIYFNTQAIINRLLTLAKETTNAILSLHAIRIVLLVQNFSDNDSELTTFINGFSDYFGFVEDCRAPFLLQLFPDRISLHIHGYLNGYNSTLINQTIMKILDNMDEIEFEYFIKTNEIPQQIIQLFSQNVTNGHLTKLAEMITERCSSNDDEWMFFSSTTLSARVLLRDNEYGQPPSENDLTTEVESSSGEPSDEEEAPPPPPKPKTRTIKAASWDGRINFLNAEFAPSLKNFDFIAPKHRSSANDIDLTNDSVIPAMEGTNQLFLRRNHKRRHEGTASLSDLPPLDILLQHAQSH